ncbi:MAG: heme-binding protein [Alphaproteobacteria bacterium]|nr:heme-binding protein [Alphaproteobacteria bacterium]
MNITLDQANTIIGAIMRRAEEKKTRAISVIVVEPGCIPKAFQKEDGASMVRFEMAYGKCWAALALGRDSSLVKVRHEESPSFTGFLIKSSGDKLFPEGGGMQIRDDNGEVIGAVGVTGDTEVMDHELALHGIRAAGLKIDTDFEGKGRKFAIRRTKAEDGR